MADVSTLSDAVAEMAKEWPMLDALLGGTLTMRAAGKSLLPQWPKEDSESYTARLNAATLFPAFPRTVGVMSAKPFACQFTVKEGAPQAVVDLFDNIDLQGSSLHEFAEVVMKHCLGIGIHGVLVDYPKVTDVATRAEEKELGVRPYFTHYPHNSILGWKTERTAAGAIQLSQLRLRECVYEDDGEFGETAIQQIRVLEIGSWRVFRKERDPQTGQEKWVVYDEGTTTLDEIPFRFFYGIRKAFGVGKSPLLDLAYLNVEHWQSSSDQRTILHVARVPILFGKNIGESGIVIGSNSAVIADNTDADLKYVEHTGASISAGKDDLLDLEERMRQVGAELLTPRPIATTATAVVSDGEANKSLLLQIVEKFETTLNECIDLLGDWIGQESENTITLFKDFGTAHLADQSTQDLITAYDKGAISRQTLFQELQRRDVISTDVKWEDEEERLKAQEPPEKEPLEAA